MNSYILDLIYIVLYYLYFSDFLLSGLITFASFSLHVSVKYFQDYNSFGSNDY